MEYLLNDFAGIGQVQWTQNPGLSTLTAKCRVEAGAKKTTLTLHKQLKTLSLHTMMDKQHRAALHQHLIYDANYTQLNRI